MTNASAAKKTAGNSPPKFSKEQLVHSDRFARRRDLLNALLRDDKLYTITEAETMIQQYLKGKVN